MVIISSAIGQCRIFQNAPTNRTKTPTRKMINGHLTIQIPFIENLIDQRTINIWCDQSPINICRDKACLVSTIIIISTIHIAGNFPHQNKQNKPFLLNHFASKIRQPYGQQFQELLFLDNYKHLY